jgi:hypothetical protein
MIKVKQFLQDVKHGGGGVNSDEMNAGKYIQFG